MPTLTYKRPRTPCLLSFLFFCERSLQPDEFLVEHLQVTAVDSVRFWRDTGTPPLPLAVTFFSHHGTPADTFLLPYHTVTRCLHVHPTLTVVRSAPADPISFFRTQSRTPSPPTEPPRPATPRLSLTID
jgi:hypothetical protein